MSSYIAKIEPSGRPYVDHMSEIRRFRHIYKTDGEDSVESTYVTQTEIGKRFVIRDETDQTYCVFESQDQYLAWFEEVPEANRQFHEVIFGWKPQKIKVDLDIKHTELAGLVVDPVYDHPVPAPDPANWAPPAADEPADNIATGIVLDELNELLGGFVNQPAEIPVATPETKANYVLSTVISALKKTFYMVYFIELDESKIIICDSSGLENDHPKFSYHIIVDGYALSSHMECKMFTNMLLNTVTDNVKPFIDAQVNKSLQNFRLPLCHKRGSARIKRVPEGIEVSRVIITNVSDCVVLHPIINIHNAITRVAGVSDKAKIDDKDVQRILDATAQYTVGHQLRKRQGNMFIFNRLHSTRCDLCNRDHVNDHTLYLTSVDELGVIKVFEHCRHNRDGKTRLLAELIASDIVAAVSAVGGDSTTVASDVIKRRTAEARLHATIEKNRAIVETTLFDALPDTQKNIYDEPTLRPFELKDTLCIKANMKMGKTKALKEYLSTHFSDGGFKEPVVRILSFRQTFSSNIKEKFQDFTLYSDVRGPLTQNKLIVQVESLHRLDIHDAEYPDLLVMDECESIFEQFDSGLLKSFSMAWATFEWLLRYSKHVIVMDANLSDRTYRLLKRIRIDHHNAVSPAPWNIFYHCDRFRNASGDTYYLTSDRNKWYWSLHQGLKSGAKIAVPSSSLTEAELVKMDLEGRFPAMKIGMYSSKTSTAQKKEHFNNVHEYWSQYDILIYTPTVTAGISYEKVHFSKIFAYFTDKACNAETCQQMLGRVRNVTDKEFYICVSSARNNLPDDIDAIRRQVNDRRLNLYREFDTGMLSVEFDDTGHVKCHESNYYHLWLENMRVRNLSINNFSERFVRIISQTGATVKPLVVDVAEEDLLELGAERKDRLTVMKERVAEMVATAPDLDDEGIQRLEAKVRADEQLSPEEDAAFSKYKLRRDYQWGGPIDSKFVTTYDLPSSRRVYRRLCKIMSLDTADKSLERMRKDEAANYSATMNSEEKNQYADLRRVYVYDLHRVALGIIKIAGFRPLFDRRCTSRADLAENFEKHATSLYKSLISVQAEFDLRNVRMQDFVRVSGQPDELYIGRVLKHANRVLSDMYDLSIKVDTTDRGMYLLVYGGLFALEENATTPYIRGQE